MGSRVRHLGLPEPADGYRVPVVVVAVVGHGGAWVPAGGEGWTQVEELGLALALSAVIGLEREIRQKSAGLRTHTLVGVGAALFMLVSKYGFSDVLRPGTVVLDPSRMAAQIVTGVGFLGAGIIFVRRDSVRGLTTAAAIWVTAAVGAAAGAGLAVLATLATGVYLLVALVFARLTPRLPSSATAVSVLRVRYLDGRGALRSLLEEVTSRDFAVDQVATDAVGPGQGGPGQGGGQGGRGQGGSGEGAHAVRLVEVTLHVHGRGSVHDLAAALSELDGVDGVAADDANAFEA